jgi:hypothetical protein
MKLRIVANLRRTAGWWEVDGGVCGDAPADIVDDYLDEHVNTTRTELIEILQDHATKLGKQVSECWQEAWGRNPTSGEIDALVDFCMHSGDPDETDD